MSAAMDVVRRARGLGIDLHIDAGQLRFKAPGGLPDDLKGELRLHKTEIINLLSVNPGPQRSPHFRGELAMEKRTARPLPKWCKADCPHLETIPLPSEGETAGCLNPVTGTWRRMEWLGDCPSLEKRTGHGRQEPGTDFPEVIKMGGFTEEQSPYFAAAWPWIKEHKVALLSAGWTIPELVRRSRYRWPMGPWGLAWLPVWSKPGVVVVIGGKGEIVFTWRDGERIIKQTARPC